MDLTTQSTANANAWREPLARLDGLTAMQQLYNRLDGMYPNIWRANFKSADAIENWETAWSEAFDDEGLNPKQVFEGLRACRRAYDMPPSLTQFLKACRPMAVHATDAESLFHRAVIEMRNRRERKLQDWPSRPLFWAAAALGKDLLTMPYRELQGRWKAALDANATREDEIPDVKKSDALPPPAPAESRKESAKRLREYGAENIGTKPAWRSWDWAYDHAKNPSAYPLMSNRIAADALQGAGLEVPDSLKPFLTKTNPMEDAA
jgi:hypothetical protein